jgi:phage-related protein
MAYTYGALTIPVTADTRNLRSDITGAATSAGQQAAGNISSSMSTGLRAVGGLGAAVGKSVATGIGAASVAAAGFGVEAFKSAARAQEMDTALIALARSNNLNVDSLRKVVGAVKDQGIELGVAQNLTAQFVRSNLDLAKASDLARVAQDAAVISGRNSTEVLDDLVHGITTQNTQVLRNAGIQVNATKAQDEYAKTLGKSRSQLTEAEKAQATLNAVLTEGGKVAGAYKLAMEEPGKVLRSFPRLLDDIKISVGQGLVQAFSPMILSAYDLAKALAKIVEPGGALAPVFDAIGVAVGKLIAPLNGMIETWTAWLKNLRPEQIEAVTNAIKRFGPAILAGAAALTALVAPGILTQIPILGGMLTNLLGPAKLVAGGLGSVGKAAAVQLIPGLSGAVGPIGGVGAALGGLALPVTAVVAGLAALMIASSDFRGAMIDLGKGVLDFLMPILKGLWEGILKPLALALWEIVRAIGDALAPTVKELAKLLKPLGELFGQVAGDGAGGGGVSGFGAAIAAVLPLITGLIKVIGFIIEVIVKVLVPIAEVAIKLITWVNAITSVLSPLRLLGTAIEWLIGIVKSLWHWITGHSPGLIPAFGLLGSAASALASLLGGPIAAAFSGLVSVVSSATSAVTGAVREGWSQMTGVVSGAMSQIQSTVSSGFSSMVSMARSAGSSMVEGLKSGLSAAKSMGGWIGSNVTGPVTGFIKSGFGTHSPSTITITIGGDLVEGLRRGLEAAKQLGGWIQGNVTGPVVGWLKSGLGIGSPSSITITFGADIIEGLKVGLEKARELGGWIKANVCDPILGTIKGFFGIGSPSKLMMGIGEDLTAGLEQGFDPPDLDLRGPHIGSPLMGSGGLAGVGNMSGTGTTINVYPQAGQDEREIAAQVSRELAWATAGGVR